MKNLFVLSLCVFLMAIFCFTAAISAGDVTLAWNPVPNAYGYKIYYGEELHLYHTRVDIGNVTRYVFSNVDKDKQCCFAISYIDSNWVESGLIDEVCGCGKTPRDAETNEKIHLKH